MQLPLSGASYNVNSEATSVQRTINLIPSPVEAGNERVDWVLKDVPALINIENGYKDQIRLHSNIQWFDSAGVTMWEAPKGQVVGVYVDQNNQYFYVAQLTDVIESTPYPNVVVGQGRVEDIDIKINGFDVYSNQYLSIKTILDAPLQQFGYIFAGSKLTTKGYFSETQTKITFLINGRLYSKLKNNLSAFSEITSLGNAVLYSIKKCVFLDSRIFLAGNNSANLPIIQWSALNDPNTYDPLDFASPESAPDGLVSIEVFLDRLVLFGSRSTEIWFSTGDDNVIQRNKSLSIDLGLAAELSVAKNKNSLFWIAKDNQGSRTVVKSTGGMPQKISNRWVDEKLNKLDDSSIKIKYSNLIAYKVPISQTENFVGESICCFAFSELGRDFYAINIPDEETTLVYDDLTGQWHERASFKNGNFDKFLGHWFMSMPNTDYYIGKFGGFYKIDPQKSINKTGYYYTDSGDGDPQFAQKHYTGNEEDDVIVRQRTFPVISSPDGRRLDFSGGFEIVCDKGRGGKAQLSWSDDNGRTWSSWIEIDLGEVGKYNVRARRYRLGKARQRVFSIRCTENVSFNPVSAWVDVK